MGIAQTAPRPLVEFTLSPLGDEHGIPLAIMGILVVFLALTLILAFISMLPRLLARFAPPAAQPGAPPLAAVDDRVSEELVVVIAAAVAETLDKPHRIVSIRGLTPAELGWSLEGRMHHHQSHGLRPRNR